MSDSWVEQVSAPGFLAGLDRFVLARRRGAPDDGGRGRTQRASGLDWVGHRAYQAGDDFRHLDWHLYGRFGRPYVRRFAADPVHRLDLLIDRSRSMTLGTPSKADLAAALAFVLGYVALGAGGGVAATCFSAGITARLPAGRGPAHRARLLDFLRRAPAGGRTDLAASMGAFASLAREVGELVVLSDLLDPAVEPALAALRRRGFDVTLIRLRSACDEEPDLAGGEMRVVDAETGEGRVVWFGDDGRTRYRAARRAEAAATRRACAQAGVGLTMLGTWLPLGEIVFDRLPREGLFAP